MNGNKKDFIDAMRQIFDVDIRPYIDELVKREVDGRVHSEAMTLLTRETESVIRESIRAAVRARVEITVSMKP